MEKTIFLLAASSVLAAPRLVSQTSVTLPPTLLANLRARVDAGWAPGFSVGVVDSTGTHFHAFGRTAYPAGDPVHEDTIYEIASITKAFTGLLLADMTLRGEVALDDPVQRHLPAGVRVPRYGNEAITLRHLAQHRSGLPSEPSNLAITEPDPFASYGASELYAWLATAELTSPPGSEFHYSNLGVGLLGHALALRAGLPYQDLVRHRILDPLGMGSTMVTLTPEARARLAPGFADGASAPSWHFDVLVGTGALRSSARDMTRLLAAAAGFVSTPLDAAFRLAADAAGQEKKVGLGWQRLEYQGRSMVWHDGGSGGYRSFAAFEPGRLGVVILTNSTESLDDLSRHLVDPALPLDPVPVRMDLLPELMEQYPGRYRFTPTAVLEVRLTNGRLDAQVTGQHAMRIWPSAVDEFFYRTVSAHLSFTRDKAGRVDGVILRQAGTQQRAPKEGRLE